MNHKLVDVYNVRGDQLRTYTITMSADSDDAAFKNEALAAATMDRLVPADELRTLRAVVRSKY